MSFDPTGRYKGRDYDPDYHLKIKLKKQGQGGGYNQNSYGQNRGNYNNGGSYNSGGSNGGYNSTPPKLRERMDYPSNGNGYGGSGLPFESSGGGGRYDYGHGNGNGNSRTYGFDSGSVRNGNANGYGNGGNSGSGGGGDFNDRREYNRPNYGRPDPYGRDGGRDAPGRDSNDGGWNGSSGNTGNDRGNWEDWATKVQRVEADVMKALEQERLDKMRQQQQQEQQRQSLMSALPYGDGDAPHPPHPSHPHPPPPPPLAARFTPYNSNQQSSSSSSLPPSSSSATHLASSSHYPPSTPTPMQVTEATAPRILPQLPSASSSTTVSASPAAAAPSSTAASDKLRLFKEQVERSRAQQQLSARSADDPVRAAELYLQKKDASRPPSPAASAPPPPPSLPADQQEPPEEGEVVDNAAEIDRQTMLKERLRQAKRAKAARSETAPPSGVIAPAEPTKPLTQPATPLKAASSAPAESTTTTMDGPNQSAPNGEQGHAAPPNGDNQRDLEPERNGRALETPFAIAARKRAEQRTYESYPPRGRSASPPRQRRYSPPRTDPVGRVSRFDTNRSGTETVNTERRLFNTTRDRDSDFASRVGGYARPHPLGRRTSSSSTDSQVEEPLPPQIQPSGQLPWPLPRAYSGDKTEASRFEARSYSDTVKNGQSSALTVAAPVQETAVAVVERQPPPAAKTPTSGKVLGPPPNHWVIKQLQLMKAQISELEKLIVQDDAAAAAPAPKASEKESPAKQAYEPRQYAARADRDYRGDNDNRRRYDNDDDDRRPNYKTYNKNDTGKAPYERKTYHNTKPYDRPYQKQQDQDKPYSKPYDKTYNKPYDKTYSKPYTKPYDADYSRPTHKAYADYSGDRKQGDDDWQSSRGETPNRGGRGRGGYRGSSGRGGYSSDSGRGGFNNYNKRDDSRSYGGNGSNGNEGYQNEYGGYQRNNHSNNDRGDDYGGGGRGGYSRGGGPSNRGGRGDYNGGGGYHGGGGQQQSNYFDRDAERPRY
ncbi:hypothetical protein Q8F55_008283 [Vanrija albida]|uniref:Uncharacterized protein n=1 Tax=Vanrija albida TaxID=181172 RepID=A0ABR3PW53_9TREE